MRRPGRAPRRHPAEAGPGEGTAGAGPAEGTAGAAPAEGTAGAGPAEGTAGAGPAEGTAGAGPAEGTAGAGPAEGTAGAGPGAESVLDCRGQRCPQPVLELARHLRDLPAGTTVRVLADDPAARTDIPAWCRMRSQDYLGEGPGPSFLVRRRG